MINYFKCIALTGGIGTGKSTVAKIFTELGVPTISSDEFAHEALSDKSIRAAVLKKFGDTILDGETLSRTKLADIVFKDEPARRELEKIVHPFVHKKIADAISLFKKDKNVGYCIVEIPLLFEVKWEKEFQKVIVVTCSEKTQVERVCKKFGISKTVACARIKSQLPLSEKTARADYVISNDGSLADLKNHVLKLRNQIE